MSSTKSFSTPLHFYGFLTKNFKKISHISNMKVVFTNMFFDGKNWDFWRKIPKNMPHFEKNGLKLICIIFDQKYQENNQTPNMEVDVLFSQNWKNWDFWPKIPKNMPLLGYGSFLLMCCGKIWDLIENLPKNKPYFEFGSEL